MNEPKPKKSIYKRWWFWVVGGFFFIMFFGVLTPSQSPQSDSVTQTTKEVTEATTESPKLSEAQATEQPSVSIVSGTTTNIQVYTVTNVVDGDTIDVSIDGEIKRLRLIGVDTPETKDPRKAVQCFGTEASAFTTQTLLNQSVTLESDDSQGDVDKYDRLLRYVILSDGTNFNKLLIHDGYAYEYTYDTIYTYQDEFKAAQVDAEANKRGLWADDTCAGDTTNSMVTTQDSTVSTSPSSESDTTTSDVTTNTDSGTTSQDTSTTTAVCDCSGDNYNCGDFSNHSAAQDCYEYCLEQVGTDIHRLDGNNDGSACE